MTREPFYTWRVAVGDTKIPMLHYRQKTTRLQWLCLMKMVLFILIIKAIHDHCTRLWQYEEIKRKWKPLMNQPLRDNYWYYLVLGTYTYISIIPEILISTRYNEYTKWDSTINAVLWPDVFYVMLCTDILLGQQVQSYNIIYNNYIKLHCGYSLINYLTK